MLPTHITKLKFHIVHFREIVSGNYDKVCTLKFQTLMLTLEFKSAIAKIITHFPQYLSHG